MTTAHSARAGQLTFDGDYATLTFERCLRHPINSVWEALTESEHLERWYMTKARIEARAGGFIDYWSGPSQLHVTGKILTWDPPHVFEHEWNVDPRGDLLPKGEKSIIRWELLPDGDGTILRLTHEGLTRQTAMGFISGTHAFLDRLENQLNHEPLVDWRQRFEEVMPNYPKWGGWA